MRLTNRKSERTNLIPLDLHITKQKYDALAEQLTKFKKIRPRLANEVKRLSEMGDFSENAAYQIAKGKLRGLNRRLAETEHILNHAVIIQPSRTNSIQLGSTVLVDINGRTKQYEILGSSETDPTSGIISHNSPLGQALMGKMPGDVVHVKLNNKTVDCKVIDII